MMDSDERNIELLIKQLKEGEEIDLRCIAAEKLGNKQNRFDIIIPALVEGLNDDNWLVRVEIAKSLGRLGQNALTAIEPLKKAMNEPRNRAKRGHFYEIITGLEEIKASGPEITPEPVVEEQKIVEEVSEEPIEDKPTEEITERVPEEVIEEIKEEEVVGEDIEEIVEDIADDLPEDATDDTIIKEAIEEITEEVIEDVIEDSVDDSVDEDVIEDLAEDIAEGIAQEVVELEKKIEEEKEDKSLSDSEELEVLEETVEDTLEDVIEEVVEDSVDEDVIEELAEDIAEEVIDITEETVSEDVPLDEVLVFKEDEEEEKKTPSKPIESDGLPTELDVPIKKMEKTLLKVVLVGDEAVGKTTLRKGYCDTGFSSEYKEVIGADFASKQLEVKDEKFVLQVWDIAAKERFKFNKELYFRGLIGALLVFDVSNKESFNDIAKWLVDIVTVENKELALVLVGNKIDLRGNTDLECTNFNDGQELAAKLSTKSGFEIPYIETSALTGAAVEQAFQMLTDRATAIYFKIRDK